MNDGSEVTLISEQCAKLHSLETGTYDSPVRLELADGSTIRCHQFARFELGFLDPAHGLIIRGESWPIIPGSSSSPIIVGLDLIDKYKLDTF